MTINRLDAVRQELNGSWVGPAGYYRPAPTFDQTVKDVTDEFLTMQARTPKRVRVVRDGRVIRGSKGRARRVYDEDDEILGYECYGPHGRLLTLLQYDMEDAESMGAWQMADLVARIINGEK